MCRPQHLQPAGNWAGSRHRILCCGIASCIGGGGAGSRPPGLPEGDHKDHQEDCHAFFVSTSGVDETPADRRLRLGLSPQRAQGNEGPWMPHAGSCLSRAFLCLCLSWFMVSHADRRRKRYSVSLHQLPWLKFKREITQWSQF